MRPRAHHSAPIRRLTALAGLVALEATALAESPYLYGIHDHEPAPTEFLNIIKTRTGAHGGWVTATVAVGDNPNDFSGVNFSWLANAGHTVICRINFGYFPHGTIPVPSRWDNFALRCRNFVANSTGCNIWLIANETNLAGEWPLDPSNNRFNYISPQAYATCFRKVYNAIKSVRPNDKVIVQALAPWAGPYGPGTFNVGGVPYPHDGMPLNWVQYCYQMLTNIQASGPVDGIALHVGSRGYDYEDIHSTAKVNAGGQSLYWSFYVLRDWVDYGIPASLYHLPLYVTECNGLYYWKGGGPPGEPNPEPYKPGWVQEIYAQFNRYNQWAATNARPIIRCVNLYRWCAYCDGWNIDGADNPYKAQILADLDAAVARLYRWPTNVLLAQPPALLISPTNGQGFLAPATLRLEATNTNPSAVLTRVEFREGSTLLGVRTSAPFTLTLSNLAAGTYNFTALATDSLGASGTSLVVRVTVLHGTNVTLVPAGAVWKYLDTGVDPGPNWMRLDFNDSAWRSGPARLGYGGDGEVTLVASNRLRITTYFRRAFVVEAPRAIKALYLRLLRDDGAVVYLNGTEAVRSNMPEVSDASTLALSTVAGADEQTFWTYVVDPGLLVRGTNLLAVEVHQSSTNSSDLGFDLELTGLRSNPAPPRVSFAAPAVGQAFFALANVMLVAQPDDEDEDVSRVDFFSATGTPLMLRGQAFGPPWSVTVSNLAVADHRFWARAIDRQGLTSTLASLTVPVIQGRQVPLVAAGSRWRYWDNGTDPGPTWAQAGFNDAAWPAGPAQLGYGDGDEATTNQFGPDPNNKFITTYYRHRFVVGDPPSIRGLTLRLLRDDGAVVYLNGVEIRRDNLPPGPISFNTLALAAVAGADESTWFPSYVDPSLLVPGTNLLAVEVHQVSPTSSDISFDLELVAAQADPPRLGVARLGETVELFWPLAHPRYTVQWTARWEPPVRWWPLAGTPIETNEHYVLRRSHLGAAMFFRLAR